MILLSCDIVALNEADLALNNGKKHENLRMFKFPYHSLIANSNFASSYSAQ